VTATRRDHLPGPGRVKGAQVVEWPGKRQEDIPNQLADGRYTLGDVLGTGACATVYRAQDTMLGVQRAVKIIAATGSARHKQLAERLVIEARAMARLSHPNILRVYDIGVDGAFHYVVMDLAVGGSLGQLVDVRGALAPQLALRYCVQVLSALAAAHAQGVIHRDVKPQNILLSESHAALLADFGIAMLANDDALRSTRTNVGMGSFAYMAPEQRVNARHVAPSADLYGVACTLYNLLTGASPIDLFAVTDRASDRWQGLPNDLIDILQQALRYDPSERYQDARAMAADMRVALEGASSTPLAAFDPLDPHNFPEPSKRFVTAEHRIVMPRREELPGPPAAEFKKSLTFLDVAEAVAYPTLVAPGAARGDTAFLAPPADEPASAPAGVDPPIDVAAWQESPPGDDPGPGMARWLVAVMVLVSVGAAAVSIWNPQRQLPAADEAPPSATPVPSVALVDLPETPTDPGADGVSEALPDVPPPEALVEPARRPEAGPEPLPTAEHEAPAAEPAGAVPSEPPSAAPAPSSEASLLDPPFGAWGGSMDGQLATWVLTGSHERVQGTFTLDNGGGGEATEDVAGHYDPRTRTLVLHDETGRYDIVVREDGRGFDGRYSWDGGQNVRSVNGWRTGG